VIVYVYVHGRHIALHVQTRETWTDMDKQTITVRDGLPLRARSAQNRPQRPGQGSGGKPGLSRPLTAILTRSSASAGPSWDGTLRHRWPPEGSVAYPFQRLLP